MANAQVLKEKLNNHVAGHRASTKNTTLSIVKGTTEKQTGAGDLEGAIQGAQPEVKMLKILNGSGLVDEVDFLVTYDAEHAFKGDTGDLYFARDESAA